MFARADSSWMVSWACFFVPTKGPCRPGGFLAHEAHRLVQLANGLLEVDDVDTVALGEDKGPHARIPAAGLVTEVHTRLK